MMARAKGIYLLISKVKLRKVKKSFIFPLSQSFLKELHVLRVSISLLVNSRDETIACSSCCHSLDRDTAHVLYLLNKYPLAYYGMPITQMGGAVASWLVCSTPERAVRVRALAGDSASQCLSPPRCIKRYRQVVGET